MDRLRFAPPGVTGTSVCEDIPAFGLLRKSLCIALAPDRGASLGSGKSILLLGKLARKAVLLPVLPTQVEIQNLIICLFLVPLPLRLCGQEEKNPSIPRKDSPFGARPRINPHGTGPIGGCMSPSQSPPGGGLISSSFPNAWCNGADGGRICVTGVSPRPVSAEAHSSNPPSLRKLKTPLRLFSFCLCFCWPSCNLSESLFKGRPARLPRSAGPARIGKTSPPALLGFPFPRQE